MSLDYKQIIIAIDGSVEAEWAFKKAVAIADRNNATLNLVNIVDTRSYSSAEAYDRSIAESAHTSAVELLNNYKAEAVQAGVQSINVVVEYGSPKVMIAKDLPSKLNADLIICGATGLNTVERFIMGSVSENIVRSAKCDVLVIRRPEDL
ncbi:universal stress protein [Sporosarcina luteola]|uniref:universal stress protein n=1 Tax=Sporosarcina luteola TaxID=582850 RepID=UPI00203B1279|nr:universal stress protein [Sporosarcina luteola]MCM3745142.1 universal stress protein [Sporosarcina luteola]